LKQRIINAAVTSQFGGKCNERANAIRSGGGGNMLPDSRDANQSVLLDPAVKTQKQLRMYKEFWDSTRDAFLLVQCPDGSIIDANPAACSLYGYEHACVANLNLADISAEHESTKAVFANRLTYIPIRIHKNSDGRKILVTATVSYFIDKTGVEIAACTIRPIINQHVTGGIINDIMLDIAEFQQNA